MASVPLRGAVLMVVLLAHGALGATASAAEDPADALLRRGAELRKNDRHEEALELFRKAHAISPSGRTLAQMGLAEFSLKAYVDAEAHLVGALAEDSPWIVKNRGVLEQALADVRKRVARINISGPPATEVSVNGRPVGRLPLAEPVHVAEGTVRIEGNAPNHRTALVDIKVTGGQLVNATLELVPIPAPVPAAPAPPIVSAQPPAVGPTTERAGKWKPWVGGGLLAVSAGALATGIVWIAVDGNAACDIPASAPPGSRCLNYYDTKTLGWIAVGAGVAAGVAGGILIWTGRGADVELGIAPGSLTAIGRF